MFHEMEEIAGNANEKGCQDGEEEDSGHPRQEEQALEPSRRLFIHLLHMNGEQGGGRRQFDDDQEDAVEPQENEVDGGDGFHQGRRVQNQ